MDKSGPVDGFTYMDTTWFSEDHGKPTRGWEKDMLHGLSHGSSMASF